MLDTMLQNRQLPSVEEARVYLEALDLSYIAEKMSAASYPLPRWQLADAKRCEALYKRFLLLFKLYPGEALVPTRDIDEFWHNHILHTKNYHEDCRRIFGHYLHHTPATEGAPVEALIQGFLRTKKLYFEQFQVPMELVQL